MKQSKRGSLNHYANLGILIPGLLVVVGFSLVTLFAIIYALSSNFVFLILLIVTIALFGLGVAFYALHLAPMIYKFFYNIFYKTTKENFDNLAEFNNEIKPYPEDFAREFNELNDDLAVIRARFSNSTLVSRDLNYDFYPLAKYKNMNNVYTFKTFKENLNSLILASYNFRNVVMEIYYEFPEKETLSEEGIQRLLGLLNMNFSKYEKIIFAVHENNKSIFAYIPYIDSFSRLKEQLTSILPDFSMPIRTSDGADMVPAKVSIVAYPYSDVDEIFHDLRYAKNTEEIINLYLPQRMIQRDANTPRTSTSNLNVVSKICESLGRLNVDDSKKSLKVITDGIKEFAQYIDIDVAGLIVFDKDTKNFYSKVNYSKVTFSLFQEGNLIDTNFINALRDEMDFDHSYYFSTRDNANTNIGRHLDRYDIDSGFYYVAQDKDDVLGIVYFFNKKTDLKIDSYIREGLVLFSSKVGDFIIRSEKNRGVLEAYDEIDSVLALTDYGTYKINKETHLITGFSNNMKQYFSNIEEKQPCYKCLYGLDRPCPKCPLQTAQKLETKCGAHRFETSLTLVSNNNARNARMLIKHISDEEVITDRYQKDLLINSFSALVEDLNNSYSIASKGHLLLLRIDNLDDLLANHDSENVLVAMRNLAKNIRLTENGLQNIYYFNPQCLAILYKESGQIDVVNRCEKIYEESKKNYFDEWNEDKFNITYLPVAYPAGYPKASDFIKHCFKFFENNKGFEVNNDIIYLEENGYKRPASRRDFMLSVIDDKFGNKTFNALLQPYVIADDRKVYGAEMLLRLTDDYRKITFNADELIKIAAANQKISLISDALIDYIGNLYEKQGSSIFKVFGLKRISINTDFSYFQDEEAVNKLIDQVSKYHFPAGFLGLEIAEWEVKNHYSNFQGITDRLIAAGMTLICDQFSGRAITIEKLKTLKFSEIKVGRGIGGFLDSDPQKCATFTDMVETAKALGLQVSVVGIENNDQYEVVRKLDKNAYLQGYYFYKPLDKNDLVNALRNNNSTIL